MVKCTSTIERDEIELFEITGECRYDFLARRKKPQDRSEFEQYLLVKIGNALRSENSQYYWENGNFTWYTDGTKLKSNCLWITTNGIPILEDMSNGKLFHVALHAS